MFSRKMIALFVTFISVVSFASAASAAVVSIDFQLSTAQGSGSPTGISPLATGNPTGTFGGMGAAEAWNALLIGGPHATTYGTPVSTGLLLQSGGAATTAVFTVTPSGIYHAQEWTTDPLRGDELTQTAGNSTTWSFTGLIPGNQYDIRFFGNLTGSNGSSPGYTVVGGTVTAAPSNTDREALSVTATGGQITGTSFIAGTNPEWTGIQIQGTFIAEPVPEPSAFVLAALGLAGLGLVAWRRRK